MNNIDLRKKLEELKNDKKREFYKRLIFTSYPILGISMPDIKKIIKELIREKFDCTSIEIKYYEESLIRLSLADRFLPFKDLVEEIRVCANNWATVDSSIYVKYISKNPDLYYDLVLSLLKDPHEFVARAGTVILMRHYMEFKYLESNIRALVDINVDQYYLLMGASWEVSNFLIKYKKETEELLKKYTLNPKLIKIAYQKARDSKRYDRT